MSAVQAFENQLRGRLKRLQDKDRLRTLRGREGIDLSSNDYLGLAGHPQVRAAMIQALQEGASMGSTGSRLLRGNCPAHDELEQRLAHFKQREAALIFNSGYDANVGVLSTLCGGGDLVFSDALIHASMIDGLRASKAERIIFHHNDTDHLEHLLKEHSGGRNRFIIVESLYSMDGDPAPLQELNRLAADYNAMLIVDEAHATGVFGPNGAGLSAMAGIQPLVTIHTCGKAWGSFGAYITCSSVVKDYLINNCRRFIFTTALPPLLVAQWNTIMDVIADEPWRARHALDMANRFRQGMKGFGNTGASQSQIVPLICGKDHQALRAAEACMKAGFDIRAIRPPTVPTGTARLRIAFNANFREQHLERLLACCRNFGEDSS